MTRTLPFLAILLLGSCAFVVRDHEHAEAAEPEAAPAAIQRAICVLWPTAGNGTKGVVKFSAVAGGVRVEARVEGLTPGLHGFHVHEWGDLDCTDGMCTGGHFNPTGQPHAGPDAAARHVGDLGNLEADSTGLAVYDRTFAGMSLDGAAGLIGRGLVVHAKPDDFTTQPTGNAGARVATGVIGIAKPQP